MTLCRSACTHSCGGGYSTRSPAVKTQGKYGGKKCPDEGELDGEKDGREVVCVCVCVCVCGGGVVQACMA